MKTFDDVTNKIYTAGQRDMIFVFSGMEVGIQSAFAQLMGVTNAKDLPLLMVLYPTTMTIYKSEVSFANMNVDSVLKFLDDVKNGEIKPFLQN